MKHRIRSLIYIIFLAYGIHGISSTAHAVLIFEDDFESGTFDSWTIGGRQLAGINLANTVERYGSLMGHLYKTSFTEITLEKDFAYDPLLNFMFDIEVTSNGTIISPNYYAYSGVDFYFYDAVGAIVGRILYGTASTSYLSDIAASDPTIYYSALTEGALINFDLGMAEILSNITIDESSIDYFN
ncbi:MAG: hypothetical protein QNJ78_05430 [Gammaproteobacteria bacterium]|nr:hypothetical protein [Gammaproteobacteria bacterium]